MNKLSTKNRAIFKNRVILISIELKQPELLIAMMRKVGNIMN